MSGRHDAVVVGSGPNGLAAAIELARNGAAVHVIEGHHEIGGGARTAGLTLPGFRHDVCAAAHPLGPSSPFLAGLPLAEHGLEWVTSPAAVAHPLDDGSVALLEGTVDATAGQLGEDGEVYRRTVTPLVEGYHELLPGILGPLVRLPRHPWLMARFGWSAVRSGESFARRFVTPGARALYAGLAAHSGLRFDRAGVTGTALALAVAGHRNGWPVVRGGSGELTGAMASYLRSLGGTIETGRWVGSLDELAPARAVLLDVTPRQLLDIAGDRVPRRRRRRLRRWEHGPAIFKIDYALSEPVPWTAAEAGRATTVHVGGTFEEVAAAERAVGEGAVPARPFVLVTQPSRFDPTRAPDGHHVLWAYCHVPPGTGHDDVAHLIEAQIERFAPGFGDLVLDRHVMRPADFAAYNPNDIDGTIDGGAMTLGQIVRRPWLSPWPYLTGIDDVYLCSSSTPPGAGAHGMCGFHAAHTALRRSLGRSAGARRRR